MPIKVAVLGAGSVTFTRRVVRDILCVPELQDAHLAFMDINEHNLSLTEQLCTRDIEHNGVPAVVSATTDRREALTDANYVFSFMRIGGLEAYATDIDIPLKYGVDQCVGDTLGPGGIMFAQRAIPVLLDCCKDISEVAAPGCWFINHTNPMAMNSWACNVAGHGINYVGLCHGVEGGAQQISQALGIPLDDLHIICAGINHQTWYIKVEHNGEDLTGKLLEAFENHETYSRTEKCRIDVMRRFGYFSTESNGHLSEYLPWYRKRPDDIANWIATDTWIMGETGGYLRASQEARNWYETDFPKWMEEDPWEYAPEHRTGEHGSYIIEAMETGRTYRGYFNMPNRGCINNLPADAIIEAPGFVDRNGINMPIVGELPSGPAAICNASISVQRLSVEAALSGDDFILKQAMMMDPLTGAVCNPPEVWQMADEMLVAQEQWLPQYSEAIAGAKERQASDDLIPPRDYTPVFRQDPRDLDTIRKERGG
jgi:alpha-galactosidase